MGRSERPERVIRFPHFIFQARDLFPAMPQVFVNRHRLRLRFNRGHAVLAQEIKQFRPLVP